MPPNEVIYQSLAPAHRSLRASHCTATFHTLVDTKHAECWLLTIRESAVLLCRGSVLISDCQLVMCFALVCWINDKSVLCVSLQAIVSGLSQVQFVFIVWTECVALC